MRNSTTHSIISSTKRMSWMCSNLTPLQCWIFLSMILLINYLVTLKHNTYWKNRINAWFFSCAYQFSKQWSGSLISHPKCDQWRLFKSIIMGLWIKIYLVYFNPLKLTLFSFSYYPIFDQKKIHWNFLSPFWHDPSGL